MKDDLMRKAQRRMDIAEMAQAFADGIDGLYEEIDHLETSKNDAYRERNKLLAAFTKLCQILGFKAGIGRHQGSEWDLDWRNIIFIELPTGQVSWHIHDTELGLFHFLPRYEGHWDGHSTETKYERLLAITSH